MGDLLDLSKTLEGLDRKVMLGKLRFFCGSQVELPRFEDYFRAGKHLVFLTNISSTFLSVSLGRMQWSGSVFLMFLQISRDLKTCSNLFKFKMDHDNVIFLFSSETLKVALQTMNKEFTLVAKRLKLNGLTIKIMNTVYIIFHS